MRKRLFIGTGIFMVLAVLLIASTAVAGAKTDKCTTIQSGDLLSSTGDVLTTGYDEFGYNYQAHQYGGYFGNYQRPPAPVDWGERLMMKWMTRGSQTRIAMVMVFLIGTKDLIATLDPERG